MSAYIVDDSTINKIVGYLYNDHSSRGYGNDIRRVLKYKYDIILEDGTGAYDEAVHPAWFACCLRALNERAIGERYGEKAIGEMSGGNFHYENIRPRFTGSTIADGVNLYKSVQCLHYQCSEGDATGDELYAVLESISHMLAAGIIHHLPEYDKAEWA